MFAVSKQTFSESKNDYSFLLMNISLECNKNGDSLGGEDIDDSSSVI